MAADGYVFAPGKSIPTMAPAPDMLSHPHHAVASFYEATHIVETEPGALSRFLRREVRFEYPRENILRHSRSFVTNCDLDALDVVPGTYVPCGDRDSTAAGHSIACVIAHVQQGTPQQSATVVLNLLFAGHETTTGILGNCFRRVLADRAAWGRFAPIRRSSRKQSRRCCGWIPR